MDLINKLWKSALTLIIAGSTFLPMKNYAQNQTSQVDSTLISKPMVFKFNVTHSETGEGIENVGINVNNAKNNEHLGQYYDVQEPIYTDVDGNARMPMHIPTWDKITGIEDLFGGKTVPDKFYVNAYPNPFNSNTNVVFFAEKQGKYMYEVVDPTGSRIASGGKVLSQGSYSFPVNTGAGGMGFARIIGPDGVVSSVRLVNLGGGSPPKVGEIGGYNGDLSTENQAMKSSSNNSSSSTGRVSKSNVSGEPIDTIYASYGKAGLPGGVLYGAPIYGVEHLDTAIVLPIKPNNETYSQNIFIPGVSDENVDTVKAFYNSVDFRGEDFWNNNPVYAGKILIYNQPGGYPADSLDFQDLELGPTGSALGKTNEAPTPSMNEIERPDMKYNMPKSENLENKLKSIRQKYDNIQR